MKRDRPAARWGTDASTLELARELGATLHPVPWLSRLPWLRGMAAVTIGRRVFVLPAPVPDARVYERLLRHELAHVAQYREEGLIPFLYRYLREYLILRADGLEPLEAYRSISFEREAREAETRPLETLRA